MEPTHVTSNGSLQADAIPPQIGSVSSHEELSPEDFRSPENPSIRKDVKVNPVSTDSDPGTDGLPPQNSSPGNRDELLAQGDFRSSVDPSITKDVPETPVPPPTPAGNGDRTSTTHPRDGAARPSAGGPRPRGKPFPPGNLPGPGRPLGRRNNLTIALNDLLHEHGPSVMKRVLAGCYKGDHHCLKMIIDLLPVHKDHIAIAIPNVKSAKDIPRYLSAVNKALRLGEISVADARELYGFADVMRIAFETQLMARALEQDRIGPEEPEPEDDGAE